MARPLKSLHQHVLDGTFRSERHKDLLQAETLPHTVPPLLRELQARFRSAGSERERQGIRVEFGHAARTLAIEATPLSMAATLYAEIGPMLKAPGNAIMSFEEICALESDWEAWDGEHGLSWRVQNGCAHNGDLAVLHTLVTGREERNVDAVREVAADLLTEYLGRHPEPAPDPPGWQHFR